MGFSSCDRLARGGLMGWTLLMHAHVSHTCPLVQNRLVGGCCMTSPWNVTQVAMLSSTDHAYIIPSSVPSRNTSPTKAWCLPPSSLSPPVTPLGSSPHSFSPPHALLIAEHIPHTHHPPAEVRQRAAHCCWSLPGERGPGRWRTATSAGRAGRAGAGGGGLEDE